MSESSKKWVRRGRVWAFAPAIFLWIPVLVAYGIWLGIGNPWASCVNLRALKEWFLWLGILMLISGLVSSVVCCFMSCAEGGGSSDDDAYTTAGIYLFCGIVLDLVCLSFAIYVSVLTKYSGSPHLAGPGRAYPEYRFNHFNPTLRSKVSNPYKWGTIITCLAPSDACLALNTTYPTPPQLFNAPLSPLQFGCCMPPAECGFNFVSPTTWTSPTNTTQTNNFTNADCAVWGNEPTKLCYSFCCFMSCAEGGGSSDDDAYTTAGIYLFCGIVLDLVCLSFAIYVSVLTKYSGSPHLAGPGRAYPEYRFNHFNPTLRSKVSNPYKWGTIITCLAPSDACLALNTTYPTLPQLFNAPLSPLQFGCCMPPAECGFNFVSPTTWTSPTNTTQTNNFTNADCAVWDNEPTKLCYSCNSCKAGSLAMIRKNLINTNIVLVVMAMVSFILALPKHAMWD
ncbi:hypothetical protein DM860_015908 [Cuscuta australis]|uniref:Tetraspanin n=1 Tax=Cuscuta australis TaxID=267555 RepID=A0A328E2W1_9ASTE|nr:hypothetical protein DM860_015908 [Cuscuta australis]